MSRAAVALALALAATTASAAAPTKSKSKAAPAQPAPAEAVPAAEPPRPAAPVQRGLDGGYPAVLGELAAAQLAQLASFSPNDSLKFFGHWDKAARKVVLFVLGPRRDATGARRDLEEFRAERGPVLAGFIKEQYGVELREQDVSLRYVSRASREELVRWEDGDFR